MEGLGAIPLTCLVDSGALSNRFSSQLAEDAGIDLSEAQPEPIQIGGRERQGRKIDVQLSLGDHIWNTDVTFMDDWDDVGYQVLGQEGFFRWFEVCFKAADLTFDVEWAG